MLFLAFQSPVATFSPAIAFKCRRMEDGGWWVVGGRRVGGGWLVGGWWVVGCRWSLVMQLLSSYSDVDAMLFAVLSWWQAKYIKNNVQELSFNLVPQGMMQYKLHLLNPYQHILERLACLKVWLHSKQETFWFRSLLHTVDHAILLTFEIWLQELERLSWAPIFDPSWSSPGRQSFENKQGLH